MKIMRGRWTATVRSTAAGDPQRISSVTRRTTAQKLTRALSSSYRNGSRNRFRVCVRPIIFRLWWILIMVLHAVCAGFFGLSFYAYWKLPSMSMGYTFDFYRITMPSRYLRAPALCFAAIALAHAFLWARLFIYCVWHRRFTFDVHWCNKRTWDALIFNWADSARYPQWCDKFSLLLQRVFSRRGIFGIESEYFELVYIMREVLETALQSTQAYEMSLTVSLGYLSQFMAIMIFINCWSTPIVLHHFAHHPPLARLICLLLDIGLDFLSTVLAPLVLVLPYFQYYDSFLQDFTSLIWYDDVLLVKAVNEFRLVMITTWPELVTRILFCLSMLMCLESAKSLLCPDHPRIQTQRIFVSSPSQDSSERATKTDLLCPDHSKVRPQQILLSPSKQNPTQLDTLDTFLNNHTHALNAEASQSTFSIRLAILMHIMFMAWGFAVLVIHIQATTHTKLTGCALQVHPWFAPKSACALMYINCKNQQTDGNLEDLDKFMIRMDEHSLVHIVIRHCSNLEIPPRIQTFPQLIGMKIYNSTLTRWDTDAALTRHHHPNIVFLFLVDVNMTQIPDGLLSEEFPQQVRDIEISGTNLTNLPDALDERWGTHGLVVIELCQFRVFPRVLSRMKVSILVIGSNQITEIPIEIFTNPNSFLIALSDNPIGLLPSTLSGTVSAKFLIFDHTELTTLPSWVDDTLLEQTELFAVGTLFCDQIKAAAKTEIANSNISTTFVRAYETGRLQCDHVSKMVSPYYPRALEKTLDEKFGNI